MNSKIKIPGLIFLLLFLPFFTCADVFGQSVNDIPHVMKRGVYRLQAGMEIADLVVSEGDVDIRGVVHGSVFVVDGDVTIRDGGVVHGNVTVIDEDLKMESGAVVKGSVVIIGGRLKKAGGARIDGETTIEEDELSDDSLDLMEDYLVFERPVPEGLAPEEGIEKLAGKFRTWKDYTISPWTTISLEGLQSVPLPPPVVSEARLGSWKRNDWELKVGMARFGNINEAESFWKNVYGQWSEEDISRSVHVSLGGGAHWFFRHGEISTALWIKDGYLVMVEVGHGENKKGSSHWAGRLRDEILYWINIYLTDKK